MATPREVRDVVRAWILKAEHDLLTAERTFTPEGDCPFDMVCFHAQQCAEKYLNALLIFHGLEVPRTHDLTEILPLLSARGAVRLDVNELAELNPYAVAVRYPGLGPEPGPEEARRALEIARRVRAEARTVLPIEEPR